MNHANSPYKVSRCNDKTLHVSSPSLCAGSAVSPVTDSSCVAARRLAGPAELQLYVLQSHQGSGVCCHHVWGLAPAAMLWSHPSLWPPPYSFFPLSMSTATYFRCRMAQTVGCLYKRLQTSGCRLKSLQWGMWIICSCARHTSQNAVAPSTIDCNV